MMDIFPLVAVMAVSVPISAMALVPKTNDSSATEQIIVGGTPLTSLLSSIVIASSNISPLDMNGLISVHDAAKLNKLFDVNHVEKVDRSKSALTVLSFFDLTLLPFLVLILCRINSMTEFDSWNTLVGPY